MSFFGDLIGGVANFFGFGGSTSPLGNVGSNIAKTAILGFALNQINKSIASENQATQQIQPYKARVDQGVRLQVPPAADEKIPVCYGRSTLGGIISDARLSTDQKEMYYVITISERTGSLLSTSADSAYTLNDVFINDERIIFESDGITCDYTIDRDGNKNFAARGVVQVYFYAGNSETQQAPEYYSIASPESAYDIVPGWTTNHMMEDLIFAVVKITYSPESGLRNVPNVMFNISNTMTLPGDVLYDYMTSTRYGCGIASEDILV